MANNDNSECLYFRRDHCYVFIDEREDAEDAVKELKGRKVRGERIVLEFLERDDPEDNMFPFPRYRLKVTNLSQNTASHELKDHLAQAGDITECEVHSSVRGEGVVQFARYQDMRWALEQFHDSKLSGRNIKLTEILE